MKTPNTHAKTPLAMMPRGANGDSRSGVRTGRSQRLEDGTPRDEWRCGVTKRNGERCRGLRVRGTRACRVHGGLTGRKNRGPWTRQLPVFYSKVLTATLSDYVERCLGEDPRDSLKLHEELALMRHSAGEAVRLYGLAIESRDDKAVTMASMVMRDSLEAVASMCERAARVEFAGADKVSVHQVAWVVNQVVALAYRAMTDADAREFERLVREQVRIQAGQADGTTLTPDQAAIEMDDTIPTSTQLQVVS